MIEAVFGIENNVLNLIATLLVFFLVTVWLALVYWTYSDARRRLDDPLLVGCATVAALFPFIGTIIYMIVRPPEFLEDARERELEILSAQARVKQLERQTCPNCRYPVESGYLRCPSCMFQLKEPCSSCGKPVDPSWQICPFCEAGPASGRPAGKQRAQGAGRKAQAKARPG